MCVLLTCRRDEAVREVAVSWGASVSPRRLRARVLPPSDGAVSSSRIHPRASSSSPTSSSSSSSLSRSCHPRARASLVRSNSSFRIAFCRWWAASASVAATSSASRWVIRDCRCRTLPLPPLGPNGNVSVAK
jgi:hypothetical protein